MDSKPEQGSALKSNKHTARKSDQNQKVATSNGPVVPWPWKEATIHPAVASMPPSAETSIKSVAQYIAKHEPNQLLRIKALHDYVADRIAYDGEAYFSGNIPPQDAESTFKSRKSVCAGYANLLCALADAIDEKIVVVVGDARDKDTGDNLAGRGHAWNAAQIDNRWYLIDACWDAGSLSKETGYKKHYRTDYFLPPPEVMIEEHFPEQKTWQLLAKPLTQSEFLRQPILEPSFKAADLTLVAPVRAVNDTGSQAVVILKNPRKQWLMVGLERDGKGVDDKGSTATNNETAQIECLLPDKGTYRVNMFANQKEYGTYEYIGSVNFVNR